jgi:ABC-type multidrug transport system fused ATPase/permease subunit
MAEPNKKNEQESETSEDLRFKYIGFEIFPQKVKSFWRSEEEKREYLEKVKQDKSQASLLERDHSLVKVSIFSKADKIVLAVSSFLLAISLFVPWFSVRGENLHHSYIGLGVIFKLGTLFGYASSSGFGGVVSSVLLLFIILSSCAVGVLSLLSIFKKYDEFEGYLTNLKKTLKLNLIPLALWVVLLFISIIGMPTPFAKSMGVKGLGNSFNIISLFALSSYGMWFSLACLIINCVKINDL